MNETKNFIDFILAAKDGKVFFHKAYGRSGFGQSNYLVQKADVFSIGRLTNFFTYACALKLIEDKIISSEDKLNYHFENVTDPKKRNITVKNLILHNSGYGPKLSRLEANWKKEDLIFNILQEDLEYKTGFEERYSPLNVILLQEIIEKLSGEKLPKYFEKHFREPLDIVKSGYTYVRADSVKFYYNPTPPVLIKAKTQADLINNILKNETESTSAFDGFYTNAIELALFLQMIIQDGYYDEVQLLNAEVIKNWLSGFEETGILYEGTYKLIDPGGCSINLNYDENYFIIILTNAEINNPDNHGFVNFSNRIIQLFEAEINREIL